MAKKARRKGQGEVQEALCQSVGGPGRKQKWAVTVSMRVLGAKPAADPAQEKVTDKSKSEGCLR